MVHVYLWYISHTSTIGTVARKLLLWHTVPLVWYGTRARTRVRTYVLEYVLASTYHGTIGSYGP